jgi:hypothetical protein
VSGEKDEESSRRRLLALLAAALLALIGAGTGVSNLFGRDDEAEDDGVELSVDYDVTPDEPVPTPTPTPTPGGGAGGADDATDPPERPEGTTRTGADGSTADGLPRRDDPGDEPDAPNDEPQRTTTLGDDVISTSIPPVSVADVEPGDGGTVDLSLTLSGSPARLWVRGDVTTVEEGGTNEAERDAGDTGAPGELQEYVRVRLWYDADGEGDVSGGEPVGYEGTLAGLDARDGWTALTEACVSPGTHTARFRWDLPSDAPNVVQTDGVTFSLAVAADTSGCA